MDEFRHPKRQRFSQAVLAVGVLTVATCLSGPGSPEPPMERRAAFAATPVRDPAEERLEAEIERLAAGVGGTPGVSAVHLPSGRAVSVNGGVRFPMASVYKIPIAVRLLTLVDQGRISLDRPVHVRREDLRPGSGTLRYAYHPRLTVTVGRLLDVMLTESDNTACDLLLGLAGGPAAVTGRMRELGLQNIDVGRGTLEMLTDEAGAVLVPRAAEAPIVTYNRAVRRVTREQKAAAEARFARDPRDTATPDDVVRLLALVHQGKALSPASTQLLLDVMRRCETGDLRLKRFLPPGTTVAHKTGTLGAVRSDVGYIELPDGDTVAVAVFVRSTEKRAPRSLWTIGEIGRALYDYFVLSPAAS